MLTGAERKIYRMHQPGYTGTCYPRAACARDSHLREILDEHASKFHRATPNVRKKQGFQTLTILLLKK